MDTAEPTPLVEIPSPEQVALALGYLGRRDREFHEAFIRVEAAINDLQEQIHALSPQEHDPRIRPSGLLIP